jgi:hypothetical protein
MIVQSWVDVLQQSFYGLLYGVVAFLPNLLFAIIIFIIGWFIGSLLGRAVMEAVRAVKVDHALRSAGVDEVVSRAGYSLNSGAFLGALVKWFVIIVFLLASLQALGLTQVTLFLQLGLLPFLGRVIVAVLIILVAAVIAEVAQGVVAGAARAAGVRSAGFAGTLAKWAIWAFALLSALDVIGITPFLQTLFTGLVVALAIAFGLAFGLGGQEAASRAIEKARESMKDR